MSKICLFDVDGTLTPSRLPAHPEMYEVLKKLRQVVSIGVVTGSDFCKLQEQLGQNVQDIMDYCFTENGLVAYKGHEQLAKMSIHDRLSDSHLKQLEEFCMDYINHLDIPKKTSNFFEVRNGMINVSPVGRNCTQEERIEFFEFDKKHHIREQMCKALAERFEPELQLTYTLGGQISIDIYPIGWSKIFCLQYVEKDYSEIHFFGDHTAEGGNDHEIAIDPRVIPHAVVDPDDTIRQLNELFLSK